MRFILDDDFDDSSASRQDLFDKTVDGSNYIKIQLFAMNQKREIIFI